MKYGKKILSLLLSAVMLPGVCAAGFTAGAEIPLSSMYAVVTLDPEDDAVDPGAAAIFTLIVEGLGTNPEDNMISSVNLSSSDTDVADIISLSAPSSYTPSGSYESTGLQYTVTVSKTATGVSYITATVTDTGGNEYTGSGTVTVRGIIVSPRDITLEKGEACVLFAERYGFSSVQAQTYLTWSKSPNSAWISMGVHGANRQKEAYYIKGEDIGIGTVTVSLRSGSTAVYSETVNVIVVPEKGITISKDDTAVTAPVDLSTESAVTLNANCDGFSSGAVITWESSRPDIVSVSPSPGDSVTISREAFSDDIVAVKATATDGTVTRTKTIYVTAAAPQSLKITGAGIKTNGEQPGNKYLTLNEGETVSLSAQCKGLDATATIWSATTGSGRVPVKLNSTVGSYTEISGRLTTADPDTGLDRPVIITAQNGNCTDTIYVSVTPADAKSVKITGSELGADGVLVLQPRQAANLRIELANFSPNSSPAITWQASVANNNENTSGTGVCPVILDSGYGEIATITASSEASTDFAKVRVSVTEDGKNYTDEIYVKVTESNIIKAANYLMILKNEAVTLQTLSGYGADWRSASYKLYFNDPNNMSPTAQNQVTNCYGPSATLTAKKDLTTTLPVKITATQNDVTDSVYVKVINSARSISTISFDLNGGYGTTPEPVLFSQDGTSRSIILREPDAAYPDDDGEYVFCGWSEYPNAIDNTNQSISKPIYPAGQLYTVSSSKTLYAVWAKKTEDAMFIINISGYIPAEPSATDIANYSTSAIYIADALNPPGFYYNTDGVDSHLAKVPSDEDISRVLSLQGISYEPGDRVIWYVVKRVSDDDSGLPNWHVDGVLIKGNKISLSYDSNIPVANVENMPNPPRMIYDCDGPQTACIVSQTPQCSACDFIGWNTEQDGSGQWYLNTLNDDNPRLLNCGETVPDGEADIQTEITFTEDTTLYAIWKGPVFPQEDLPVTVIAHSLTLNGDIGVNFYADVPVPSTETRAEFTVDGKTVTVPIDPAEYTVQDGVKLYKFSCNVAAAQIDTEITGTIGNNINENAVITYSVQDYLTEAQQQMSDNESLMALAGSLATYGYYANDLFGYNNSFTQHSLFDDSGFADVTATSLAEYDAQITNSEGGVNYIGSSLVLRTRTSIRHYFTLPADKTVNDYTFLLGEGDTASKLTPVQSGNRYFVEIPGIASALLGEMQTVSVIANAPDGGTAAVGGANVVNTWTYSALSYVYKALTQYEAGDPAVSDALANTVKALTLYYMAADTYFKQFGN